jgi:hypothetical protein
MQVRPLWLPFLHSPEFLAAVLRQVQNTLQSELLVHSLKLLTALLQADRVQQQRLQEQAAEQQNAAEQQQQQPIYQCLMQAGLMTAVQMLLAPTVELGPAALEAMIIGASNGTDNWDDLLYGAAAPQNAAAAAAAAAADEAALEDEEMDMTADEIAAESGDITQQRRELYASQPVLEALLALLLQLGRSAEPRAAALQQLPDLPEMLLHVLAASGAHHQQRVLESLLPVLVVFRGCVVALMQPVPDSHLNQHLAQQQETADNMMNNAGEQQLDQQQLQQQQEEERQQQVKGLCLLACIASALQNGEPGRERPDAHIAGWGLLAMATRNLQVLELHLQQRMQQQLHQQQQQVQLARQHAVIPSPASCRFLEHICTRLTRSPAPDAAAAFVGATVHVLVTCVVATLFDGNHAPPAPQQEQQEVDHDQQQQQQEQMVAAAASQRMNMSILRAAGKVNTLMHTTWRRLAQQQQQQQQQQ